MLLFVQRCTLGMVTLPNIYEVETLTQVHSKKTYWHEANPLGKKPQRYRQDEKLTGYTSSFSSYWCGYVNQFWCLRQRKVNYHISQKCGTVAIFNIIGGSYGSLNLKRSYKVVASKVNFLKVENNKVLPHWHYSIEFAMASRHRKIWKSVLNMTKSSLYSAFS